MERCKDCKWWEIIEEGPELAENNAVERGRCHRMPPTANPIVMPTLTPLKQVVPQVIETTIWPITMPVMYCGEFAKAGESGGYFCADGDIAEDFKKAINDRRNQKTTNS